MSLSEQMQRIEEIRKQAEEVTVGALNSLYEVFKATPAETREWVLSYLIQADKELREQGK